MARTIPEPTEEDLAVARHAALVTAESLSMDVTGAVESFIDHQSRVHAQMQAEIRWLRSIIHESNGLRERA